LPGRIQVAKLPGKFDRLGVQRLLASKGEELPGQICAAFGCLPGGIQISPEPRDLRPFLRGEVEVSENDRQQIVEIVSDTAGDRADGLQPLALLKNFLDTAPLCRVGRDPSYSNGNAVLVMINTAVDDD
jgi:hypothetical protein